MTLRSSIQMSRTVPDSNAPQLWRLTRKAVTTHAERHRGRSACDVVGWSKCKAGGSRGATTTLTLHYLFAGVKTELPPSPRFSGVGGSSGEGCSWGHCMTKEQIVALILMMKGLDVDYARYVLKREHALRPEMGLIDAVREALK